MTPISAVIITFNEEQNIARCIESLLPVADDIVVVDSYSTDGTEAICKQFNVRFVQHKFEGHIQQKNWAITQAKYPHVLSLDADEVLDETLQKSILKVKQHFDADGYYVNRLNYYCGTWIRHGDWYPDRKLRLWDSRKGAWGGKNPHDTYILKDGCSTKRLKGDLKHYSFFSVHQHIEQINKFTTIAAQVLFEKGKKYSWLSIVVKTWFKFFNAYFIKLGFLDGSAGFSVAMNSAWAKFLKLIKLRELWRNENK